MRPADLDPAVSTAAPLSGRTEPLRVVFLASQWTGRGLGETWGALIERLNAGRFDVQICSLRALGEVGERLARRFPSTSRVRRFPCDAIGLARWAKRLRGRTDAVVSLGDSASMWWGTIAARWSGTPVALSLLDESNGIVAPKCGDRLMSRWSDGLVFSSEAVRRRWVADLRLPADKAHVITPGVDTGRYCFQPADAFQMRQHWAVPAGAPLCGLLVSRDVAASGQLRVGLRRVLFQLSTARFVIWAPDSSDSHWAQWIAAAGLQDRVTVLSKHDDWRRTLSALQVMACWGPAPAARLLEGMAAQVPVVVSADEGINGLVQPDCNGFLVGAHDLHGWVTHVVQLLQDARLARRLGECGRQHVLKHWSLDVMVRRYEQLICDTYQRKRSGPGSVEPQALVDGVEFCGITP